jgi:hypothetical protein
MDKSKKNKDIEKSSKSKYKYVPTTPQEIATSETIMEQFPELAKNKGVLEVMGIKEVKGMGTAPMKEERRETGFDAKIKKSAEKRKRDAKIRKQNAENKKRTERGIGLYPSPSKNYGQTNLLTEK